MIDRVHVDFGLQEQYVTDGQEIVWHYVDDYAVEEYIWEELTGGGLPGDADKDLGDGETPLAGGGLPYTDVRDIDWFYNAVAYVFENGLMNGVSESLFSPQGTMTRAMVATVLYRAAGSPDVSGENPFTDVLPGQWYTDAIIWANANGIINGYGNGKFGVNDPVTREQLVAILYRYEKLQNGDIVVDTTLLDAYFDAPQISEYAVEAFAWAVENGIVTGRTATTLAPVGTATRAEVATILERVGARSN
jgi:hypothetical protein